MNNDLQTNENASLIKVLNEENSNKLGDIAQAIADGNIPSETAKKLLDLNNFERMQIKTLEKKLGNADSDDWTNNLGSRNGRVKS